VHVCTCGHVFEHRNGELIEHTRNVRLKDAPVPAGGFRWWEPKV
jgi:hypothetical protein